MDSSTGSAPRGEVVGMALKAGAKAGGAGGVARGEEPDVLGPRLARPARRKAVDARGEDAREEPAVPRRVARQEAGVHVGVGHSHGREGRRRTPYQRSAAVSSAFFRSNSARSACPTARPDGTLEALKPHRHAQTSPPTRTRLARLALLGHRGIRPRLGVVRRPRRSRCPAGVEVTSLARAPVLAAAKTYRYFLTDWATLSFALPLKNSGSRSLGRHGVRRGQVQRLAGRRGKRGLAPEARRAGRRAGADVDRPGRPGDPGHGHLTSSSSPGSTSGSTRWTTPPTASRTTWATSTASWTRAARAATCGASSSGPRWTLPAPGRWPPGTDVAGAALPLVPGDFFFELGTDLPLGALVSGRSTTFRIFAPQGGGGHRPRLRRPCAAQDGLGVPPGEAGRRARCRGRMGGRARPEPPRLVLLVHDRRDGRGDGEPRREDRRARPLRARDRGPRRPGHRARPGLGGPGRRRVPDARPGRTWS